MPTGGLAKLFSDFGPIFALRGVSLNVFCLTNPQGGLSGFLSFNATLRVLGAQAARLCAALRHGT